MQITLTTNSIPMKNYPHPVLVILLLLAGSTCSSNGESDRVTPAMAATPAQAGCGAGGGLKLPVGFCATIFADSVGAVRHMVVTSGGDVLANMQGARRTSPVAAVASGQVALRDNDRDGRADVVQRFGTGGGTGIALYKDFLYADVGTAIVRFRISWRDLRPTGAVDTIVSGLPGPPGHTSRNFDITPDGTMYVNIGSATNACQLKDRSAGSLGADPCVELQSRAGVWRFFADSLKQQPSPASRYATGLRNSVALRVGPASQLYALPHGRDQLSGNWPALFTENQNAEIPAEELVAVMRGDDFGWPYCFYDGQKNRLVLAPEYGGDGTAVGRCAEKKNPLLALPAHWGPNDMLFYRGKQFPARYREGVFVAFHGSWNRAPLPQGGFNVVFIPFVKGRPGGKFEVFAEAFTAVLDPARADHRPTGLAQSPDGSLYVSDDVGGRIWKITYNARR